MLAAGAGAVAASAYLGGVGLATGTDPYLRHLTEQLPFHSPVLGAAALSLIVGIPHSAVAVLASRGDPRTDAAAVAAGTLLIGWIVTEALILRKTSFLDPLYGSIGAVLVFAGRRRLTQFLRPRPWRDRVSRGTR